MRRPGVSSLLLLVGTAAALALPPLLLRAEPANWDVIGADVQRMPPADRNRLNRNTEDYLRLSEADRQRYRELHAILENDEQHGRGQLRKTLSDYTSWLATIHAYDRQLLLTTTDPTQRLQEIQRIVDERNESLSRSQGRFRWWMHRGIPDLDANELASVMQVVEDGLSLTADERDQLRDADGEEKSGVARYFALFSIIRSHRRDLGQSLDRDLDRFLASVPAAKQPEGISEKPPELQRGICLAMIVGNVLQEYEQQIVRNAPTDADLRRIVEEWSGENEREVDELLELEPADFRRELERKYAREVFGLDVDEVRRVVPGEVYRGRFRGARRDRGPERSGGEGRPRRMRRGGPGGEGRSGDRPRITLPFGPDGSEDVDRPAPGRRRGGPRRGEGRPAPDGQRGPPPRGEPPSRE